MSVEQNLTDKNAVTTATTINSSLTKTNKKNQDNKNKSKNNKKFIKKALKISKFQNHVISNNVNNKNTNNNNKKNNNTNSGSSSSGSGSIISNKNNIEAANDEIIEELFDFSDTDIKELDEISDNNSVSRTELLDERKYMVKENGEKAKEDRKSQLPNTKNDDNNNHNNDEESKGEEKQQVVGLILSAKVDNIDKQNGNNFRDSELVTTLKLTSKHIVSEEECVDKTTNDINQQKREQIKSEKNDETEANNDLLPNKDSSLTATQIPYSSIVIDNSMSCEADNSEMKLSTSSDIKRVKANNSSESLLIEFKETSNLNENNNTIEANNNDDGDYDDEDDYSGEPYNGLLVQFLDEANQIAEARLAARRHARAEAREIRMRELERQQKEQESNADRVFDMHATVTGITPLSHMRLGLGSSPVTGLLNSARGNSMSSRRSSEDSLEEEGRSLRDIRHELKDVEERFRKAMIANAQLDNDRASQTYQIQLLKDKLEDMEESYSQLQRECKEKTRDCNALKRSLDKLSEELKLVQGQLNERDTLIAEQGLVIVAIENEDGTDAKRALVSVENAQLLGSVQGSLDVRLKKFSEEKQQLQSEIQQLQDQLESYKSQGKGRVKGNSSNGPLGSDDDDYEAQREANKIISDYKYKLQKAEQEIASLQSSLARSETQVIRYKSTAEAAEKAEAELKIERRKLQRENREAMEKLEELETSNNHLLKRLDKLKNAKSALLKDL